MVSQIINVVVNSRGAVTVRKELNAIGDSARRTTTYLNGLRAILASALAFSGVHAIAETVDNFTVMQNRLRQVAFEGEKVGDSWERLLAIANRSYSTIDGTVALYFRVAQAYKAWGESAEDAYQFTESFQKAAILSGSTMQTTAQAVYQFSQALNKGKLDGDEFRSVLEGLPYVASLIQKSLGVTRAELYDLSKDGKISLDRIKEAFDSAGEQIEKDWLNITPTIGHAMTVLKNNWTEFIGEIQTSTGIFSSIAQLILLIADNFDTLAIAIAPVVISLGFMAGRLGLGLVVMGFRDMYAAISRVIPALWAMNAALIANPIGLIVVAIAGIVAGIIYFREELGLTNSVLLSLWETAKSVFMFIVTTLNPIGLIVTTIVQAFGGWAAVWQTIKTIAQQTGQIIVSTFKAISDSVGDVGAYMKKTFAPVFSDLIELGMAFGELIMEIVDLFVDLLTPAIEAVLPAFMTVWKAVEPNLRLFVSFLRDVLEGWKLIATWLKTNFLPIVKDVFEGWIAIIRTVIGFIRDLINTLKTALSLMKRIGSGGSGAPAGSAGLNYGGQFYAGEFARGGGFKVGGSGAGRDTTPVAFRANRGERVTVETRKQQRANDNPAPAANVNVPVHITNVLDPSMVPAANMTAPGQRSIVNAIIANRDEINYALGIS